MVDRKLPVAFVLKLVGKVRPWVVSVRALTAALSAVQGLIDPIDELEQVDEERKLAESDANFVATLHLLGVTSGSAKYAVAARNPDHALKVIEHTGRAIADPEGVEWDAAILSPVNRLSQLAKSLGCHLVLALPGKNGEVLATIGPSTYQQLTDTAFVYGDTSIYGTIERVGGASKLLCGIRLPGQPNRMIHCQVVGEPVVRELGKYIYREVVVSGKATWLKRSWKIYRFVIRSVEPPKTGSIIDALDEAYKAGASQWDSIDDPEQAMLEIRGE